MEIKVHDSLRKNVTVTFVKKMCRNLLKKNVTVTSNHKMRNLEFLIFVIY